MENQVWNANDAKSIVLTAQATAQYNWEFLICTSLCFCHVLLVGWMFQNKSRDATSLCDGKWAFFHVLVHLPFGFISVVTDLGFRTRAKFRKWRLNLCHFLTELMSQNVCLCKHVFPFHNPHFSSTAATSQLNNALCDTHIIHQANTMRLNL